MYSDRHKSVGALRYSVDGNAYSLRVLVDPDICEYYRSLVPKHIRLNKQAYSPHISVVRKETPTLLNAWGRREGEEVEFEYENTVRFGTVYAWLNVFSETLDVVRAELGLPVHSPYTLPPEGFLHCYHTTIGNSKELK